MPQALPAGSAGGTGVLLAHCCPALVAIVILVLQDTAISIEPTVQQQLVMMFGLYSSVYLCRYTLFLCCMRCRYMQVAMYATSAAPRVFESRNTPEGDGNHQKFRTYIPGDISDQHTCQTCVAQAVAAAVQMSVARTLQENVDTFTISPMALYYCTGEGRSCNTGWVRSLESMCKPDDLAYAYCLSRGGTMHAVRQPCVQMPCPKQASAAA